MYLDAVSIRAEDGRFVGGVDISAFISDLPAAAKIDPNQFATRCASGSTSMASNIIESIEIGAAAMLLDEDTCASNFLIRDSRMRSLVAHEPITPFIYRVNSLYGQLGISTIVVIGGAGDWFDVQDHTVMLDNYVMSDVSARARSISKVGWLLALAGLHLLASVFPMHLIFRKSLKKSKEAAIHCCNNICVYECLVPFFIPFFILPIHMLFLSLESSHCTSIIPAFASCNRKLMNMCRRILLASSVFSDVLHRSR